MENKMKKLILFVMLLLLYSVLNIEAKENAEKKDKNFSTNSLIAKKISDKEKVDKKKKVFDKNLNVALLTDEELNKLINDALNNCNNAELMELGNKLGIAQKYDLTPIISSTILARTKCDLKKSQQKCIYAYDCFIKECLGGKYSDETIENLYDAINGVPIGCQDWMTVGHMVVTTPFAMIVSIETEKDFEKAWSIYKKGMLAIKACKSFPTTQRKATIKNVNEQSLQSIHLITRNKYRKNIKLSLESAQEMKEFVEKLPDDAFVLCPETKKEIIKEFKTYIDEKNNSR